LGAYYLRARYYNPATGRFLTMDPGRKPCCALRALVENIFDLAMLYKYVYIGNNPVGQIDPLGTDTLGDYGALLEGAISPI